MAGMIILDDKTGNSDVGVIVLVGDGVDVSVGSGVGDCVSVGAVSDGFSVYGTLAAIAGVDEHPLLNIAASISSTTGRKIGDRNTAPMI